MRNKEEIFIALLVLIIAYLIGSIPFGFILGKIKGIDIRKHGSGNIGATNVLRILGKKYGYFCFTLDFLKGFLPVFLSGVIVTKFSTMNPDLARCIAFAGAFIGHVWTIFLGFKGGKGVATAAGALLAIYPPALFVSLIVWVIIFFSFRFVSLASVIASAILPISYFLIAKIAKSHISGLFLGLFTVVTILSIIKHRSNIKRLLNGTEPRFERKKNES